MKMRGFFVMPLQQLQRDIISCTRCPRLREYCLTLPKRRSFEAWEYWRKPVPGFGDPGARLWVVGLAPAAHGGNRTGRVFTGDRSADFLYAALHRKGFANQANSDHRDDGLTLRNCFVSCAVRCAPPDNKPLPIEASNCSEYLDREWDLLRRKRAILALGKIGWDAVIALARRKGCVLPTAPFGHGMVIELCDGVRLFGSYHVSQQNTFTGRLTPGMLDAVLDDATT